VPLTMGGHNSLSRLSPSLLNRALAHTHPAAEPETATPPVAASQAEPTTPTPTLEANAPPSHHLTEPLAH